MTYFAVNQRRREFGVRVALGATRADVRRLVLTEGFRLAGPGILLGGALAALVGLLMRATLVGLATTESLPYFTAIGIEAGVTVLASWSPAARAARASPMEVLKSE